MKEIDEQNKVINSQNQNLVVSASAGSGKTSVMIRKIIKLITKEKVNVKDLLVLTYTNSAADEMKQKLILAMQEQVETNKSLLSQIEDVALADISTFDSFCQKIVKRYFYALEIDPGFNIVQGTKQTQLFNKALKNTIDIYKQKEPNNYFLLFNSFASNRTDKNIYELVLNLYNFCTSILDFDEFKQKSFKLYEGEQPFATQLIFDDIKFNLLAIKSRFEKILTNSVNLEIKPYVQYCNKVLSVIESSLCVKDFGEFIDYFCNISLPVQPKQNDFDQDGEIISKICQTKDWMKEIIKNIKSYGNKDIYKNSIAFCEQITKVLFEMCEIFKNQYDIQKQRLNLLDYNDIERLTIKLFENKDILTEIKNNYKYIFVDEFQDANLVQEKIINCLKQEDNLFLVGDLKQAIYGFRQSDPKIFERITKQYEQDYLTNQKSNSLYLNCNFRTTKNILEFVNKVFSRVMTLETAKLNYASKAQLNGQADFKEENYPSVELNILYSPKQKKDEPDRVYSVLENLNNTQIEDETSEAYHIAERITKLIDEEIYDIKKEKFRKINYSDICVLFRSRSSQQKFIDIFNKYNIPLVENSNEDLEQTYDVKVLINALKISQNYKNDYALASVMMSELFCFDSNQMLCIKQNSKDEEYFYNAVKNYTKDDEIGKKIVKMKDVLQNLGSICNFEGIDKGLLYLLKQTNYEYKISFLNNSISRKKNIIDFVNSFAGTTFNFNLSQYLNFIENNSRELKVVSDTNSYDAVTLTTMHSSKGLEWPVVICVGLGDNFNKKPQGRKAIALNSEVGIGIKYYDDNSRNKYNTVFFDYINNKNTFEEFGEKLRLLYVALTRPKNRLILIGSTSDLKFFSFENDRQILHTSNYLSLIVNSLNSQDIEKINSQVPNIYIDNNNKYLCRVINKQDNNFAQIQIQPVLFDVDKDKCKTLQEYISKQYEYQKELSIAQKNSVSSLLKDEDLYSSYNYSPKSLTTSEHLSDISKNELGSLYHKIFELANFESIDAKKEINNAVTYIKMHKLFEDCLLNELNIDLIEQNLKILKQITCGAKVLKEQSFIMQLPYSLLTQSDINDKVMVQGVCDLIIIKQDGVILIDYKFSSLNKQNLILKYKKQLELYSKAIEYGLMKKVKTCYILDIKSASLIEL